MAKENFGERLARLRKENNLTQSDIADKLNVTSQAVSKWENNLANPDIDALVKLSKLFNITVDELLGEDKPVASIQDKPTKKDIMKMLLKIKIFDGEDGDTVNINLPLGIVMAFVNKEDGTIPLLSGKKEVEGLDFRKIIEMVENGLIGEIMSVDSKDGTKVSIYVE